MGRATQLVLTLIGRDRPGLVELVAATVRDCGGNWLESRMARLADRFAGIARVEVEAGGVDRLQAALADIEELSVQVAVLDDERAHAPARPTACVEVTGYDRPGIVHRVAQVLREEGGNVCDFSSDVGVAAMGGERTFRARAAVAVDPERLDELRRRLEELGADLMVDIEVHHLAD